MQLKTVGEICILDFSEISNIAFGEFFRHNNKLTRHDRRHVEETVGVIIDDYLTRNMIWTKRRSDVPSNYYVEKFGKSAEKHPDAEEFVEEIREMIEELVFDVIKLPTWHQVYVQPRGTALEMELGPDFRITDWMEKHAEEYLPKRKKKDW